MPALIRFATGVDIDSIARFQILMARETESKELNLEVVTLGVEAVFADEQRGFYLVAAIDQVVVGSLLITYEWSDWRNCNQWYIQSVFVDAAHRGKGIFKALYQSVIERARSAGVQHVRLYVEADNTRAQSIYESLGMKRLPYLMYDAEVNR